MSSPSKWKEVRHYELGMSTFLVLCNITLPFYTENTVSMHQNYHRKRHAQRLQGGSEHVI